MANVVLGVFSQTEMAEDAINTLEAEGYNPKDMSIMMKNRKEAHEFAEKSGAGDVVTGAAAGATTGAILGGLAGLLAAYAIPGLGAFFIGGPIASALGLGGAAASATSGALTGAAAGGLLGALTSAFDLSDEDARVYEQRINEGGILVAVPARSGDHEQVISILEQFGADNIKNVQASDTKSRRGEGASEYQPAYFSEVGRGRERNKTHRG